MCQLRCDDCPLLCSWPVGKERQYNWVWLTMAKIFGGMISHLLQAKNAPSMSSQNGSAVELWWSDHMDRWANVRHVCNAQITSVMAAQQLSLAWTHMEGFTELYNNPLHFCTYSERLSLWSMPAGFFFPRMSQSLILCFSSPRAGSYDAGNWVLSQRSPARKGQQYLTIWFLFEVSFVWGGLCSSDDWEVNDFYPQVTQLQQCLQKCCAFL